MKPKKGDTVELLKCDLHSLHQFKGETGVVEEVWLGGELNLTKEASCSCSGFNLSDYKIISKKEVKMDRKYEFSKDGLKAGDIVVNKGGSKRKVIEVLENSFSASYWDDFNSGSNWRQFNDAIEDDWTIEQPVKPKSKATLKKIAEAKKRKAELEKEQSELEKFLKEQGELCE